MKLLIISIPLLSSFSIFFFGRFLGHIGGKWIAINSILLAWIISLKGLIEYIEGKIEIIRIKEWFEVGQLRGQFDLIYDKESIVMCNLISLITLIVIIYSYWYLSEDPHLNRFISKLLLFSVSMFILVSSKNFLFTFFGWELVGVVSYLLINFWSISIQNNKCAIKALIFNKVGDIFYLLGLLILALTLYSFDYQYIHSYSHYLDHSPYFFSILSLLFLFAAMAKSAQIFLHCWLGDAMAGPTPVSALLHAATMVTAGIFLVLRCEPLLEHSLSIIPSFINIIGTLTILFAGLSALNQNDIKKIIAYSTCAQIGFMFFALSLFKPFNASLYHLVTHGFFKALLFLSAGLIIHSFLLEQDIRKYGNLIFIAPLFYIFFIIGSLAIIGLPPLSGFFSKDLILIHSLENNNYALIILLLGSILSSFYSFKILYYTFYNTSPLGSNPSFSFHSLPSYSFLFPFLFILSGSLFLGYFSSSFFSSPESISLDLEYSLISLFTTSDNVINILYKNIQILPFFFPFFTIFVLIIIYNYFPTLFLSNKYYYNLTSFFNRKFLFDPLYNYFIVKPSFFLSFHIFYKFIDRGYLEYLGPITLFRLFFYFPSKYNIPSQLSTNVPYLFFYFFLAFLLSFVFIIPTLPIFIG
ncbi:NADH dehydrogenase subunit 5 (mitochondrion) [Paramicrosporidium saccamoebae]|uniref:NADH-ubiquinone oxidoreductase chain 5 n=1 Tax=Paramicrosporidium saccamoebae TaxID=1246581 RepID=A0A2H9TR10_9FUNG|nr:NADH dehydrogenase subunit 5 [Paramicrosporidium saccamoebae]